MADQAWCEVNALTENPGPAVGKSTNTVVPTALSENQVSHFQTFDDPADWRVRDFAIRAVIFFPNGNRLFVTETYDQLAVLVKLKRR